MYVFLASSLAGAAGGELTFPPRRSLPSHLHSISSSSAPRSSPHPPHPRSSPPNRRQTIRKLVLTSLLSHQIPREHAQFRDVFSMCSKGVQFALVGPD